MRSLMRPWPLLLALLMTLLPSAAAADGVKWRVEPAFRKAGAKDLSGAVCAETRGDKHWCYIVNDEKNYIEAFSLDKNDRKIEPQRARLRFFSEERHDPETDLEAIAFDAESRRVYLVGSHGLSRNGCAFRGASFLLFRFKVKENGRPAVAFDDEAPAEEIEVSGRLRRIILENEDLAPYAETCLQASGANIEGAAILGRDLYVGFRAPAPTGRAIILQTPVDALFGDAEPTAIPHRLALGEGYGVRDMARLGADILILAGPTLEQRLAPVIWRWRPGGAPTRLAELSDRTDEKAEGLLVIDEEDGAARLLVFFDDEKNGAPTEYAVDLE